MTDNIPQSKFWTKPEVLAFCRISDSTLSRLERRGAFPARMVVGQRKVVWNREAVENWAADLADPAKLAG